MMKTQDYFELFELAHSFDVDNDKLENRFRQLQQQYHPDRLAGADDKQRLKAVQMTSQINDAYQTLKSPLKRTAHLLLLNGIDPEENDQAHFGGDFLLQQMELRERLETLKNNAELEGLDTLKNEVSAQRNTFIMELRQFFATEQFVNAKPVYNKLQFAEKLLAEIDRAEELLLDY